MNGVYWEEKIPRLFEMEDMKRDNFNITTIADISDDRMDLCLVISGTTMENPIYGVDKLSGTYSTLSSGFRDVMAVGNLPNEFQEMHHDILVNN